MNDGDPNKCKECGCTLDDPVNPESWDTGLRDGDEFKGTCSKCAGRIMKERKQNKPKCTQCECVLDVQHDFNTWSHNGVCTKCNVKNNPPDRK